MILVEAAGPILGGVILLLLFIVFAGMTYHAMRMTMGDKCACAVTNEELKKLEHLTVIPLLVLIFSIVMGLLFVTGFVLGI